MTLAARAHRKMDQAYGDAMARDGDDGPAPDVDALVRARDRGKDARSLEAPLPTLQLAELWERTSGRGRLYYVGFLGGPEVALIRAGEHPHPTRPDETVIVWRLMAKERRRPIPGRRATARRATTKE